MAKIKNYATRVNENRLREAIRSIDLSQLETVHIYGGEPMLTDTTDIILEELLPYADKLTVWYDTNATVLPSERTLRLWEKYKLIRLKFSLDGVGSAFDYLRWPAKWDEVEKNIFTLRDTLPPNHMFSLRPAIGFLNLHLIQELKNWQQKHLFTNRLGDLTEFEYTPVYGIFTAANMPSEMLLDLKAQYSAGDPLFNIIPPLTNDKQALVKIKQRLEFLDASRNLDYKKSLPHLVPYLKNA